MDVEYVGQGQRGLEGSLAWFWRSPITELGKEEIGAQKSRKGMRIQGGSNMCSPSVILVPLGHMTCRSPSPRCLMTRLVLRRGEGPRIFWPLYHLTMPYMKFVFKIS